MIFIPRVTWVIGKQVGGSILQGRRTGCALNSTRKPSKELRKPTIAISASISKQRANRGRRQPDVSVKQNVSPRFPFSAYRHSLQLKVVFGWWLFLLLKTVAVKVSLPKFGSESVIEQFAQKVLSRRKS